MSSIVVYRIVRIINIEMIMAMPAWPYFHQMIVKVTVTMLNSIRNRIITVRMTPFMLMP